MALISVDLSSGDETIDSSSTGGDTNNLVDVTALGSSKLTIDGVNVEINNIVDVDALATPEFEVINGGSLNFNEGLASLEALASLKFTLADTSTVTYESGAISALDGILTSLDVEFVGDDDATFTFVPSTIGLVSAVTINVTGMEKFDSLIIDGRSNLTFSYDSINEVGTVFSVGALGGVLSSNVSYVISDMSQAQADFITADLVDAGNDTWVIGDTFVMPVCLTAGTMMRTPSGDRLIETLAAGDDITTQDHGDQTIQWIGYSYFSAKQLAKDPKLRPIRFKAGSLGGGKPERDLLVSPQHRMLICSKVADRMFGTPQVLIAAVKLVGLPGVDVDPGHDGVTYMHVMCDMHEILFAEGAPVESLLLGPMARKALPSEQMDEIRAIFPDIDVDHFSPSAARDLAEGKRAKKLVERHRKNKIAPLVDGYWHEPRFHQ